MTFVFKKVMTQRITDDRGRSTFLFKKTWQIRIIFILWLSLKNGLSLKKPWENLKNLDIPSQWSSHQVKKSHCKIQMRKKINVSFFSNKNNKLLSKWKYLLKIIHYVEQSNSNEYPIAYQNLFIRLIYEIEYFR